ncbi:diguanylate cyclase [Amphritea atlantica]|uniref:diguanylate cyclase n=1 Tax=Amphritea atlantica TaxID=355243 RepID=A0ABY5GW73_9GAMM|nr:diguanylate cyclase [Amphritea atlantica]
MQGDLDNFLYLLDCLPVAAMVLLFNEEQQRESDRQKIVYVNKKYQQLIGYPLERTPNAEAWMEVVYPDRQHREKLMMLCHTFGGLLRETEEIAQIRMKIRCNDGKERDFQVTGDNRTIIPDHYLVTFQEITSLTAEIEQLRQQSEVDQLTGVFNQHHLLRRLEAEVERAESTGAGFTLMMFDLDFFKDVNDHYGHHCGDQVLITCVDLIRSALSGVDCLARWNGADFVVLMREDNPGIARQVIQKAWQGVRAHTFCWRDSTFAMTTTVGLTSYRRGDTTESILERADLALKRGKRVGGDFIFVDDSD